MRGLIRLPISLAQSINATPDSWIPLLAVVALLASAITLQSIRRNERRERVAWWLSGATAVAGIVWFYRAGDLDWHATRDWIKEWTYHTALRESLAAGRLPWLLRESFQDTDRFFANAETNIAPHVVLLAWLEVSTFVVVQAAALLAAGVFATYHLARDLRLGPIASMAFLTIFLMNGHVTAHLETGHGQWVTYFLLPCVLLFVHRAATDQAGARTAAALALTLLAITLVGGWHVFVWCVIFITVFTIADRSRWRFGVVLALLVAGLSAVRIIPAVLFFDVGEREFVGSFQQLSVLARALIGDAGGMTDGLDWWEYNAFVGWTGFVLALAGLTAPLSRTWAHSVSALWLPSLAMVLLSILDIYEWTLFQLPGFESQRVASRLMIVGLLGFVLIGCVQLDAWLLRNARSRWRIATVAIAGLLLAVQLVVHTTGRRPRPDRGGAPPAIDVVSDRAPDTPYRASVAAGALLTLISAGLAARVLLRRSDAGSAPGGAAC